MESEKSSLIKNDTWSLVDEDNARGRKILTNRWVFTIKDDNKFKARLVVRGCEQREGVDFQETFSPVINSSPLRVIFAFAANKNYRLAKFDIKTAFLYGELDADEEIFMRIPEYFEQVPGKVCILKKSLYGLKQTPLKWNIRFTKKLKERGLNQLKTDKCIFANANRTILLAIHVDYALVAAKYLHKIHFLLQELQTEFEMTYELDPTSYLGIEIERIQDGLRLTQKGYVQKILDHFQMQNSKSVVTPMESADHVSEVGENVKIDYPYRQVVRSLLCAANKTRPDIAFAVSLASRHLEKPSNIHVQNRQAHVAVPARDWGPGDKFSSWRAITTRCVGGQRLRRGCGDKEINLWFRGVSGRWTNSLVFKTTADSQPLLN